MSIDKYNPGRKEKERNGKGLWNCGSGAYVRPSSNKVSLPTCYGFAVVLPWPASKTTKYRVVVSIN